MFPASRASNILKKLLKLGKAEGDIAMTPLQDILEPDASARMNTPSTTGINWKWRFTWDMIPQESMERLRLFTEVYGR